MSELPFQKQAELWGQGYEVLVKRGVLACLVEHKLLDPAHPQLTPWKQHQLLDLSKALPPHRGSVAILDVMQFFEPARQVAIVDALVAMLDPGAVLVIRTGLDDGSPRARITRAGDFLARGLRWMNAAPRHYPEAAMLRARFEAAGLRSEFTPLYGDTPFNNWRVVAWRE